MTPDTYPSEHFSPGKYDHAARMRRKFSKTLFQNWLAEYKFKYWEKHASTGKDVTPEEKTTRAEEIASETLQALRLAYSLEGL